jgi:hypothetical protein
MKMISNRYTRAAVVILWIAGILISCSEQPSQPSKITDYFPLVVGSYWIYNYYETDANSVKIPGSEKLDSVSVVKELDINGRNGYMFVDYIESMPLNTFYYSKDGNYLYMLFDENDVDIPGFGQQWFRVADFARDNNVEWHVYDSLDTGYPYTFGDTVVNSNYHNTLNAKFEGKGNYQSDSGTIETKEYSMKYDTKLYFNYKFRDYPGTDTVEVDRLRLKYLRFSFCNNIGLVNFKSDPFTIRITTSPNIGYFKTESHNGWVRELLRYRLVELY